MGLFKKVNLLIAACLLAVSLSVPAVVLAADNNTQAVCEGLALTGGKCGDEQPGQTGINSVIKTVINILSLAVGIIAVIMIIVGGLKYVISSGDSSNINSAKNTILYALIGLVVVALAQVLVRFTINNVSKSAKCPAGVASTTANPCTP